MILRELYKVLTCDHSDLGNGFNVSETQSIEPGLWEALLNVKTPASHFSLDCDGLRLAVKHTGLLRAVKI